MIDVSSLYKIIPDKIYLELMFKRRLGKELNLKHPTTFNEKIQWLKLYDRNPIYTTMVDKYEAKDYVSQKIGNEYIIPTYGVWYHFDEIDFNKLPNQFVLKCTHDSGGLVICKDKSQLDIHNAKSKIERCLKRNYYWGGREWPYKNVKPRIIAEEYLEDSITKELMDYKFFSFNGVCKAMFVASNRQTLGEDVKFDFYDMNFNHLNLKHGHEWSSKTIVKPKSFDIMKKLAETLSIGIPQVRVDFYEVDGRVFFGELTFSHHCGFVPFVPEEWDYIFGSWIELPNNNNC